MRKSDIPSLSSLTVRGDTGHQPCDGFQSQLASLPRTRSSIVAISSILSAFVMRPDSQSDGTVHPLRQKLTHCSRSVRIMFPDELEELIVWRQIILCQSALSMSITHFRLRHNRGESNYVLYLVRRSPPRSELTSVENLDWIDLMLPRVISPLGPPIKPAFSPTGRDLKL